MRSASLVCAMALMLTTQLAQAVPRRVVVGLASWYGPGFEGRLMANGKRFRTLQETGAMLAVPLGTLVRVTNLDNRRSMLLRITDHGPYIRGRVLDLSLAAAFRLGMVRSGVARVSIETLVLPHVRHVVVKHPKRVRVAPHLKTRAR